MRKKLTQWMRKKHKHKQKRHRVPGMEKLEERHLLALLAQDHILRGLVYDDLNANDQFDPNEALSGVKVFVNGNETRTNDSGQWEMVVAPGSADIRAAGPGFSGIASSRLDLNADVKSLDFVSGRPYGVLNQAPRHNSLFPFDVNDDGTVAPLDALIVINNLNQDLAADFASRESPYISSSVGPYIDVNADGHASPIDALIVINRLNEGPQSDVPIASSQPTLTTFAVAGLPEAEEHFQIDPSDTLPKEDRVNDIVHGPQSVSYESTAVAINSAGQKIIAFGGRGPLDDDGVFFRRYAAGVDPLSPVKMANSTVRESQAYPSVALDEEGHFVIVWQGRGPGDHEGVFAHWYDQQGQPVGQETRINSTIGGTQGQADVAILPNGGTVVVWSGSGVGDPGGVFFQLFDPQRQRVGTETRANAFVNETQSEPAVEVAPNGHFVVTWSSRHQDGSDWGVFARIFDAAGSPLTDEIVVNTTTAAGQYGSSVAIDGTGSFVVSWTGYTGTDSGWDVFARRFRADGTPQSPEFRVNSNLVGTQRDTHIAAWPDGRFLVSWDGGVPDGSGWEVYAQMFSADGQPEGEAIQINQRTAGYSSGHQQSTSLATGAAGEASIVWTGRGQDDRQGVFAVNLDAGIANRPPVLADIPDRMIDELTEFTVAASATDLDNDTLTYFLDRAPAGATIDRQSGQFRWTPTEQQGPDAFAVTIRVDDGRGGSDQTTIILAVREVNQEPILAALANQTVDEETRLTFTAAASDADLPANTLVFRLGPTAPAGAGIDPLTGVFSWIPTEAQGAGQYTFSVSVRDRGTPELSDSQEITVTVNEVNRPPTISQITDQNVDENTKLVIAPSATDPDLVPNRLTYSLTRGPDGATIDPTTGQVNWTSNESHGGQNFPFTIVVTDNGTPALSNSTSFVVHVSETNLPPRLSAIQPQEITEHATLEVQVQAADPDVPANQLVYELVGVVPAGAAVDRTTGRFMWTPSETQGPGTYSISVRVSDNGSPNLSDTITFVVTVLEANRAPEFLPFADLTVPEGVLARFGALARDEDVPVNQLRYTLESAPASATIDPVSGEIQWTPSEADGPGSFPFTVRTTDNGELPLSAAATFVIRVSEVNRGPALGPIAAQTIDEEVTWTHTVVATDPDVPVNVLSYRLDSAPDGATLDGLTGLLRWTPTEQQGPGDHTFVVEVSDAATPALNDRATFTVSVREVNRPPVIAEIVDQTVELGQALTVVVTATDPDTPANGLSFQLVGTVPDGASIHPQSGTFTWTPTAAQAGRVHDVTVRVTDNGNPALSDDETFQVDITKCPFPNLEGWAVEQSGGTSMPGTVVANNCAVSLTEGDSFRVSFSRSFVITDPTSPLTFQYDGLAFDTADPSSINDAFEAALLDTDGNPLVPTFVSGRDAFFNMTEGLPVAIGSTITGSGNKFILDLSDVPTGTQATLVFRLVNNDSDQGTIVQIVSVDVPPSIVSGDPIAPTVRGASVTNPQALPSPIRAANSPAKLSLDAVRGSAGTAFILPEYSALVTISPEVFVDASQFSVATMTLEGKRVINFDELGAGQVNNTIQGRDAFDGNTYAADGITFASPHGYPLYLAPGGLFWNSTNSLSVARFPFDPAPLDDLDDDLIVTLAKPAIAVAFRTVDATYSQGEYFEFLDADNQVVAHVASINPFIGVVSRNRPIAKIVVSEAANDGDDVDYDDFTVFYGDRPEVRIETPTESQFTAGSSVLVSGEVLIKTPGAALANVTINGVPVDAVDSAGHFFAKVDVRPGVNGFEAVGYDTLDGSGSARIALEGIQLRDGSFEFSSSLDITASFAVDYARTSFDDANRILYADSAVQNLGQYPANVPLLVGVKNISDPTVIPLNTTGTLPDGTPYYDFTGFVTGGSLRPGSRTGTIALPFFDPNRVPFDYDLVFFGQPNHAPAFTSVPRLEALIGKEYQYNADALDQDTDPLSFRLVAGPAEMTVNGQTGLVEWTPDETDLGIHDVTIEVADGRGGSAQQHYVLLANVAPLNRPPVITSTPVQHATVSPSAPIVPFDLTAWSVQTWTSPGGQPSSNWVLSDNNTTATELNGTNPDPTALLSDSSYDNVRISGTFRVDTAGDDDAIGIVFGYQDAGHFYVFDWWQGGQNDTTKMRVRLISSPVAPDPVRLEDDSNSFATLLFKSTDVGWQDFTDYQFTLDYAPGYFTITVKQGSTLLARIPIANSTYGSGKVGFYGDSQPRVQFRDFVYQAIAPSYTYDVNAFDPDFDPIQFALIDAPTGMSIDSTTGVITWAATANQVGDQQVTVQASDGRGGVATQEYTLCVLADPENNAPVIVSTPIAEVRAYAPTNLIANGSFENGPPAGPYVRIPLGSNAITGWTVVQTDIEYCQDLWQASDGLRSLDLDAGANEPGGISQSFATVAGHNYIVTFDLAGNPAAGPTIKRMRVEAAGQSSEFTFDITGKSFTNMGWTGETWTFTAISSTTTLEFRSLNDPGTGFGPALDNVVVRESIPYRYDVDAIDPDDDTLTYSLTQAAAGMTIDAASGMISWMVDTPAIRSDFSRGSGGWSVAADALIQYQAIGGSTGGFLQVTDRLSATGDPRTAVQAPSEFLGNLLEFDGGGVTFDLRVINAASGVAGSGDGTVNGILTVTNGTASASIDLIIGRPADAWMRYSTAFTAAAAGVSQATWESILANVSAIRLGLDYFNGAEVFGLDNFQLLAPGTPADVTVRVADGRGGVDEQSFTINVAQGRGEIRGTKFNDLNGDGLHQDDLETVINFDDVVAGQVIPATNMFDSIGVRFSSVGGSAFVADYSAINSKTVFEDPSAALTSFPNLLVGSTAQSDIIATFINPITGASATASSVSLWALSGPGDDNLSDEVSLTAFDSAGKIIAQSFPTPNVQFAYLNVAAPGIARIQFDAGSRLDVIDDFSFTLESSEAEPPIPLWTIYLDQNQNGRRDPDERFTTTGDGAATVVYVNDFENTSQPLTEWSNRSAERSPTGRRFLGQFGNTSSTLTLNNLPPHEKLRVSFDLYIIRTWDGNGPPGPDIWSFGLTDSQPLLRTTFITGAAVNVRQSFPDNYPSSNVGGTGSTDHNVLGYIYAPSGSVQDAVFPITVDIEHSANSLALLFGATGLQELDDESWGIDNIVVNIPSDEVPGSYSFTDLPPGTYYVREEPQSGWTQTSPASGVHVVTLGANEVASGLDFGNQQIGDASNRNPMLTTPTANRLQATAADLFRLDLVATDPDGDPLTFDLPTAPLGMTVHPQLGVLVWQPTLDQIGTHPVVVRVRDGKGGLALQSFGVTVSTPNTLPVFTSSPVLQAVVGLSYQYRVSVQDADGDAVQLSLPTPLTGMTFDTANGVLTWTPTAPQVGPRSLTINANDGRGGLVSQSFSVNVVSTAPNQPPVITSMPRTQTQFDKIYIYPVIASDANADPLAFTLDNSPTGMTIDATGVLRWLPSAAQAGVNPVRVRVTDGRGGEAIQEFDLQVVATAANSAPFITSNPRLVAIQGQPYRYDAKAFDSNGDAVLWSLDQAPLGMSIDERTSTIRWTPREDQLGNATVILRVQDARLATSSQTFVIDVRCQNLPPAIISVPPTQAVADRAYLYAVRAEDDLNEGIVFSLDAAPTGMTIDASTGVIRWLPAANQVGLRNVLVRATDAAGASGTQAYSVKVSLSTDPSIPGVPTSPPIGNRPPVITSTPVFDAKIDTAYQYQVSALDPDGDSITFELTPNSSPAGMAINGQTGLITWTPSAAQVGPHPVSVVVRDAKNAIATQSFVVVAKANQPPRITSSAPLSVTVGATYRYDVRATDPDNDPLTYVLTESTAGMTIDNLGRIRWEAATSGVASVPVTVSVSDPLGHTATQSFLIRLDADTIAPTVRLTSSATLVDSEGRFVVDAKAEVRLTVQASDNVGIASRSLTLNGVPVALDPAGVGVAVLTTPGIVRAVAIATDAAGNSSEATLDLRVRDPNDVNAPAVAITSPDQARSDNVVTYLTNVVGSVSDTNLLKWRLDYALASAIDLDNLPAPDPDWIPIGEGTANVTNGLLGVFDPTMLANDHYVLRLYAEDTGGLINTRGVLVAVQGEAKLGNFRLEFTDLTVPLAGIPITISRVYDTLQANTEGDFGYGWSLGLYDGDIRETVSSSDSFRLGTRVYVTKPDGRRVGFTFDPIPQGSLFGTLWRARFKADPGVYDTLAVADDGLSLFPDGRFGSFVFGSQYNPSQYTLTTPDGTRYEYHQTAGLQKVTDLNGNTLTFTANAIVHSSGEQIDLRRDGRRRISEIVDPAGKSLKYAYNAAGDLVSFTDQVNLTTTFTYLASPAHYLDEIRDPLGRRASKTIYGPDGRVEKVIDALGNEVLQNFDPSNFTGTITDAKGNITLLVYNARGNIVRREDAEGGVTLYEYPDPALNSPNPEKETKVTRLGDNGKQIVVGYTYDGRGNTKTITDAFGTTRYEYDDFGNVKKVVDALGRTTTAVYNAQRKLTELVNAAGDKSMRTYDALGRVKTSIDFNGNTTTLLYEPGCPCGIPSDVINPDGTTRHFESNDFGQITLARDEENITVQTIFDAAGRVEIERGPQGQETRYFYDGHLLRRKEVQVTATEVRTTTYTYYADGKLQTETDANGGVIRYTYDKNGNLETLTDPENNKTTFIYDKVNRLKEEIDPLGKSRHFHYDKFGYRDEAIDRMNRRRTFDYDDAGRMLHEYWWDGGTIIRTMSFTYDAVGNLKTASDPDSSLTYTYDVLNRVHAVDNQGTPGVPRVILTSTYDKNGNRISVGDNLGVSVVSTYDNRNRLDTRRWEGLSATDAALADFDYFGNGLVKELKRFSNLAGTNKVGKTVYGYDPSGRADTITHLNALDHVLATYDYDYDRANQLTHQVYDGPQGDFAADYKYDPTGQLTDVDYLNDEFADELYRYDKNGNRTIARVFGEEFLYDRITGNRYRSDGKFDYTYDAEGNVQTKTDKMTGTITTLAYDLRNRVTRVQRHSASGTPQSEVAFRYDAENRRTNVNNGVPTFAIYDGSNAWADFNENGMLTARFLIGGTLDQLIARYSPADSVAWYLVDRHQSIREVVDATGTAVIAHTDYDSFGNIVSDVSDISAVTFGRFAFAGREIDADTGLYYYRARYADAAQGRFMGEDPIRFQAGDMNLYRFLANSPTNYTDPTGETAIVDVVFEGLIIPAFSGFIGSVLSFFAAGTVVARCELYGITTSQEHRNNIFNLYSNVGYVVGATLGASAVAVTAGGPAAVVAAGLLSTLIHEFFVAPFIAEPFGRSERPAHLQSDLAICHEDYFD